MELWQTLAMIVGFIAIMYFTMIRPNKKQREEHQRRIDNLRPHDKVITVGGVHGTIARIKDTTVVLKVSDRSEIEFSKDAIRTVVNPNESGTDKKMIQEFNDDDDDFLTDEEIAEKKRRKKLNKKGTQSNKEDQTGEDIQKEDEEENNKDKSKA